MKKYLSLLLICAIALPFLASCAVIFPSGVLVQRDYYYQGFDSVVVSSTFNATIIRSASSSISVTADQAMANYLDIHQSGSTLYIGLQPSVSSSSGMELNANITLPYLVSLNVSGASSATANSFSPTTFSANVSGASTAVLAGMSVSQAYLDVSGASTLRSNSSSVGNASVSVSGASTLNIPVAYNASGTVSGASTFIYGANFPNLSGLITTGASSSRPF